MSLCNSLGNSESSGFSFCFWIRKWFSLGIRLGISLGSDQLLVELVYYGCFERIQVWQSCDKLRVRRSMRVGRLEVMMNVRSMMLGWSEGWERCWILEMFMMRY